MENNYNKYKNKYLSLKKKIITNDLVDLVPKKVLENVVEFDFDELNISTVQYDEGPCGCTLLYFDQGAQVYIDKRGGSPAFLSVESNDDDFSLQGICIAGGAILGLEATCGVISETLKYHNYKYFNSIAGSMLRSHNLDFNTIYPDKKLGRFAFNSLQKNIVSTGQVGGGLSASFGQGAAFFQKDGIKIFALVVINSIGNIYKKNQIIKQAKYLNKDNIKKNNNTTISILVINIDIGSYKLEQLGKQCHTSIAETIRPFHTIFDGDVLYCCSTKELRINMSDNDLYDFYNLCAKIIKKAIYNSIKL